MPQPKKGARLGGSVAHQRKILANLCKDLIHNKSIKTTEAKAKAVRPHIEKLITKAKRGDTHNRRMALKVLGDRETAYILFEELAPLFEGREGGYTRIVKVGNRRGDNTPMAVISLVTEKVNPKPKAKKEDKVVEPAESADSPESPESADSVDSAESAPSAESAK